jgi:outer membrane protein W
MVTVLASAALLFSATAFADDFFAEANPHLVKKEEPSNPDRGLSFGLRTGYGLPFGKQYDGDANVRSDFKGTIPIWLDAGYRFSPSIYAGAYGLFGFGLMNTSNQCGLDGASCSGYDVRIGVNVQYHVMPKTVVDPWVGLGFGYEWLHAKGSGPGWSVSQTLRGFELLGLQIGADFEVDTSFKLGPFIGYSIGKFDSGSKSQAIGAPNVSADAGIANTALHEWLTLGVRGVLNI